MRSIRNYKKRKCSLRKRKINKRKYKKSKRLIKKRKISKRKFIGGSAASRAARAEITSAAEGKINVVWEYYRKNLNDTKILVLLQKILQDALNRGEQVPNPTQSKYLNHAKLSNLLNSQENKDPMSIINFLTNIGWEEGTGTKAGSYFLKYPSPHNLTLYLDKLNEMLIINIIHIKTINQINQINQCGVCGESVIVKTCNDLLKDNSLDGCSGVICESCFDSWNESTISSLYQETEDIAHPPTLEDIQAIDVGVINTNDRGRTPWQQLSPEQKQLIINEKNRLGQSNYTVSDDGGSATARRIVTISKGDLKCPFCRKNWKNSFN
jgi:hypothetical protein